MRVAILLAAGGSRRFGAANKLFARYRGGTLLARAIALAQKAPAQRLIVVTGAQRWRVAMAVLREAPGAILVHAADHPEGMGASLRAAGRKLRPIDREALIFLADMPWLAPDMASRLVRSGDCDAAILRPSWRGRPGHPVLLRKEGLASLVTARGDEGPGRRTTARSALLKGDRGCLADVDHPAALARVIPRRR